MPQLINNPSMIQPTTNPLLAEHLSTEEGDEASAIDPELMLEQILNDPSLVQHIVRTQTADTETIVAYFRCSFSVDQQRTILHIPFSPPLSNVPSVEAMVVENEIARVRVTDQQKFGARLEVVLPEPAASPSRLLVEAIVTAKSTA